MQMTEVLSPSVSPWHHAYVERVIGTIRRERLDHVIVVSEGSLRRHLDRFVAGYHRSRTHLRLQKETPEKRNIQAPAAGRIVAMSEVATCTIDTSVAP